MINIIVGTAGHIDHGKTTLVRALTGIDTDRLEEEKRRGISIDLGFAHLTHGGVRFGFVDVPGHERFIKNMLAGAGGIDMVMLVIGADESIKPQTREHFEICRLLGVRHGLIAVTKADSVDPELVELVKLETADFVAGSFLEGAPIIAVSGVTGLGLPELREALAAIARKVESRSTDGPCRLPIDRSFTLHGFGTVVTGTLVAGTLKPEDEVELHPTGRRLRVRGVQVHGGLVPKAAAGQRTAINLAAIEAAEITRGMALTPPDLFMPTQVLDCVFDLLPSANPLKHRAPIHFHSGTAEVEAQVRMLRGTEPLAPGARGHLRLHLREPLLLLPGDRFIARMFSPVITIGGGIVLDNAPNLRMRKPAVLERLPQLENAPLARRLALFAAEDDAGATLAALTARTGSAPAAILAAAPEAGLVPLKDRLVPRASIERGIVQLRAALAAFHKQNPLLPGMPRASAPLPAFLLEATLSAGKDLVAEGELLRLASHRLQLKAEEDEAATKMEALFRDGGLSVPALNEVLANSGLDANRSRNLLQLLLREGRLVRVSPELIFHREAIQRLRELLAAHKGESFAVPEFKEWTGISRKYAIPLLEFLDRERLTRREKERRLVL
ncbi:MAG: selenocysteine-specific translation elongation factor [Bryobacterales bacterium]|nr:selenocysteine-specific translation elongation factor [Bryobacterales bacterium]